MNSKKTILLAIISFAVLLPLILVSDQSSANACTVAIAKKTKFDMELSPKIPLFKPAKDGYFYPGSPKIIKNLEVRNVGDSPFRICGVNVDLQGDTHLGTGLRIKIVELGKGLGEKPNLLYSGLMSDLRKGIEVQSKATIPQRASVTLQITVWMPETAGNEYQGLSMTADIAITVYAPNICNGGRH